MRQVLLTQTRDGQSYQKWFSHKQPRFTNQRSTPQQSVQLNDERHRELNRGQRRINRQSHGRRYQR
jgi:hypothetical protein